MKPVKNTTQLAKWLECACSLDELISGFRVDSRLIKPGDVFFAIKGNKTDGHLFLKEAKSKGAILAVVEATFDGESPLPLFRVKNPLESLQGLVKKLLESWGAKIIAVTGSNGKTTTKEFISTLLEEKFSLRKSLGNSNSQTDLPLTLLNQDRGLETHYILEMGMTNPGEITSLAAMAPPDVAVITTLAYAHSENFENLADIAKAKAEIFGHPKTTIGFFPYEFSNFDEVLNAGTCEKKSFSLFSKEADYFLEDSLTLFEKGNALDKLPFLIPAKHHRHNFLAAVCVALYLGMSLSEIKNRIPLLKLPERRFEFVEKKGILFVNDSYNANELSTKAALQNLPEPKPGGKKIAVIGELLELGKFSECCHKSVGEEALRSVDYLLCYGQRCEPMLNLWVDKKGKAELFHQMNEVVEALKNIVKPGDVVLLKGSRSKELWRVLDSF